MEDFVAACLVIIASLFLLVTFTVLSAAITWWFGRWCFELLGGTA